MRGLADLTPYHTEALAMALMGGEKKHLAELRRRGSVDLSYAIPGVTRFRVNLFYQRGSFAAVLRVIPQEVPTFDKLALPPELRNCCKLKNGIVLVTGPTGSGKSTTLAAIINEINRTQAVHIVTAEDPIEYLHPNLLATVNQREIGADAPSFSMALRAALRQAPKVILVGEMRDLETIETAFEAAETGHLVLSTLHTIDCAKTVDRVIGVFPAEQQQQVRMRFAQTFKYVVSQRLVPRAGRRPGGGDGDHEVDPAHPRIRPQGRRRRPQPDRRDQGRRPGRHAVVRPGDREADPRRHHRYGNRARLLHQRRQPGARAGRLPGSVVMRVVCEHCGKPLNLPDDKVPDRPFTMTCPACKGRLHIDPNAGGEASATKPAPPIPSRRPPPIRCGARAAPPPATARRSTPAASKRLTPLSPAEQLLLDQHPPIALVASLGLPPAPS